MQYDNHSHTIGDNISNTLSMDPYFGALQYNTTEFECYQTEVFIELAFGFIELNVFGFIKNHIFIFSIQRMAVPAMLVKILSCTILI